MKVSANTINVHYLLGLTNKMVVPSYQREFCWGKKKQELFLDSLEKEIPTGIISLRNHGNRIEVIDGLHRLKMFNRILRGEGVYFDVENERLTLEGGNFDYSEYQKEDLTVLFIAKKYEEIELLSKLANSIQKVYNLRIPFIEYEGTDEEVRQACIVTGKQIGRAHV